MRDTVMPANFIIPSLLKIVLDENNFLLDFERPLLRVILSNLFRVWEILPKGGNSRIQSSM